MARFEVVEIQPQLVAVVRRKVPMGELTGFFGEAFGAVAAAVMGAGGSMVGPPIGWYHGMPADTVDVAAGFPVAGVEGELTGTVALVERPGGRAAVCMHIGPYDTMVSTYQDLEAWMAEQSLVPRDEMWEEYLSEPTGDPATWQTRIVWPLVELERLGRS